MDLLMYVCSRVCTAGSNQDFFQWSVYAGSRGETGKEGEGEAGEGGEGTPGEGGQGAEGEGGGAQEERAEEEGEGRQVEVQAEEDGRQGKEPRRR